MNTELLLRVQRSDPAPPHEAMPHGVWDAEQVLEELQRRTDTRVPQRTRAYRRFVVAAGVAAAVLVLIGGIGLLTRVQDNPDESPVVDQVEPEEPSVLDPVVPEEPPVVDPVEPEAQPEDREAPRLTEDFPPDVEAGTLTTPAGTARWVRLSRDEATLPADGQAVAWPSGLAIFQEPFNALPPPAPVSRPAQLWVSDDGIEWRVEPLPLDPAAQGASLTLVEGVYWLLSEDPSGLWRSTDGATWDEFDPSGLDPPGPTGLMWTMSYSPPVVAGGLTLSHASFEADFPFHDFLPFLIDDYEPFSDSDEGCGTLRQLEPGVFRVVGQDGDQGCPHALALRLEETETGLRVLDNATGEDLGEILGADLSHVERLAQEGDAYAEERLLIIGDDDITPIEPPWPGRVPTQGARLQALFGAQDWIYAYFRDDSGQVSVLRTGDGRSWTDLGPSSFLNDARPTGFLWFWSLGDSLTVMDFDNSDSIVPNAAWKTTDGLNWSPSPPRDGLPDGMYLVPLESGWFANDGSQGGFTDGDVWWMHAGDVWVSLAELGIEGRCDGAFTTSASNTTFFFGQNYDSGRECPDLWILSLDS